MRARLAEYGHEDFVAYVVWACERALERGLLPHTNLGVLAARRPRAAARGHRVAGADARVVRPRPRRPPGLADEAPGSGAWRRSRAAGELRIPFTSGILVGIGETEDERVAALEALAARARRARPPAGGHPAELRPARQLLRPRAGRHRRRGGARALGDRHRRRAAPRAADVGDAGLDRRHEAASSPRRGGSCPTSASRCRRTSPTGGRSSSRAGATDLGGLSANGDHISPEHPFPSPHQVRKRLRPDGVALTERLCVYPQYIDPEWIGQGVLDVVKTRYWSFIPRRGSGRTRAAAAAAPRPRRRRDRPRARRRAR